MRQTSLRMVHELAKTDSRIVFIGSDLGVGVLDEMRKEFPDRFFMEGVSEQAVIGMAAGLAMDGYIPYVNTIATFLTRRCYEQVAIDLCHHNLPVRLIANGGGLVYAPLGPTHLAFEDLAIMRALPNMAVVAVADATEMERCMKATASHPGPIYLRLGKGGDEIVTPADQVFELGRTYELRPAGRVGIISTGIMTSRALRAAEILSQRKIEAGVLHVPTVKPLDQEAVIRLAKRVDQLVTVEEHTRIGGLGSAVAEVLLDAAVPTRLLRLALPDQFPPDYGSQDHLLQTAGLHPEGIAEAIAAM